MNCRLYTDPTCGALECSRGNVPQDDETLEEMCERCQGERDAYEDRTGDWVREDGLSWCEVVA